MKRIILLLLIFSFTKNYSQRILNSDITKICSNIDFTNKSPADLKKYGTLRTECGGTLTTKIELYSVKIVSGTTFTFTISPNEKVDYDFAAWLNPNLNNVGIAHRSSKNDGTLTFSPDTGLSLKETEQTCEKEGVKGGGVIDGMVKYFDVKPGDIILIAINRFIINTTINNIGIKEDSGYTLSFGGDAILDCDSEDMIFEACDQNKDGKEYFDLNEISNNLDNEKGSLKIDFFEKYEDAIKTESTNTLTSHILVTTLDSPKKIYARFKRVNGKVAKTKEIKLLVNTMPKYPREELVYETCDNGQNGTGIYNLNKYNTKLSSLETGDAEFKFYENKSDAEEDNLNTISNINNYSSLNTTIYIRMKISNKCPVIIPLILRTIPNSIKSKKLEYSEFCAEELENGLSYNLQNLIPELVDFKKNALYKVNFFISEQDAKNNKNIISSSDAYFLNYGLSESLYARIDNENNCYVISQIELNSKKRFKINNQQTDSCEPYILEELPESYTYFTEPNGKGIEIKVNTPESRIFGNRTVYIYANKGKINSSNTDYNNCSYETSFTVYSDDCMIPKGISPNGDNINDNWDLAPFGITNLKIYNRYGKIVYSHGNGYTNQWHGQSNSGSDLPEGTYWFHFESINGVKEGWVVINR